MPRTDVVKEISIPELDDAMKDYVPSWWSAEEEAILVKYYGKAPLHLIAKYLPRRTRDAIHKKALRLQLRG